jgi:hypothetical protein
MAEAFFSSGQGPRWWCAGLVPPLPGEELARCAQSAGSVNGRLRRLTTDLAPSPVHQRRGESPGGFKPLEVGLGEHEPFRRVQRCTRDCRVERNLGLPEYLRLIILIGHAWNVAPAARETKMAGVQPGVRPVLAARATEPHVAAPVSPEERPGQSRPANHV